MQDISNNKGIIDASMNKFLEEQRQRKINNLKLEMINMVCRQSTLDYKDAEAQLEECNYNYMTVLNNYYGVSTKKEENQKTANQEVFSQIRDLMDAGASNYRKQQEMNEMREKMRAKMEMQKQMQKQMQKNDMEKTEVDTNTK